MGNGVIASFESSGCDIKFIVKIEELAIFIKKTCKINEKTLYKDLSKISDPADVKRLKNKIEKEYNEKIATSNKYLVRMTTCAKMREYKDYMCNETLLITIFNDIIDEGKEVFKENALLLVLSLTYSKNKQLIIPHISHLIHLIHLIPKDDNSNESENNKNIRLICLEIIFNMTDDKSIITKIIKLYPTTTQVLMDVIKEDRSEKAELRGKSLEILLNMTSSRENVKLMSDNFNKFILEELLLYIIKDNKSANNVKQSVVGIINNLSIDYEICGQLIGISFHRYILEILQQDVGLVLKEQDREAQEDAIKKLKELKELHFWCLFTLLSLCRHSDSVKDIMESGDLPVLENLCKDDGIDGFIACCIFSMVISHDESCNKIVSEEQRKLLVYRFDMIPQIIDILTNNINKRDGIEYIYGDFDNNIIMSVILSFCKTNENKEKLVQTRELLPLLMKFIEEFVKDNKSEDLETITTLSEILIELSLFFDNDDDLTKFYMMPNIVKSELLLSLINTVTNPTIKSNATELYRRVKKQIIAFSFAENISDNHLNLIINLKEYLKSSHYNTYEDGLLNVNVLENAYAVLVIITSEYKNSNKCKNQLKYINDLSHVGKVKVYFILVDPTDYDNNKPNTVDYHNIKGWLSQIINGHLKNSNNVCFPMFIEKDVATVGYAISNCLGNFGKK